MPSGAKRRKAAKKKKETQNSSNPKGYVSDGGEVGSIPVARAKSVEGESSDAEVIRSDGVVRIDGDSKEGSRSKNRAGSGKEFSKSLSRGSSSSSTSRSSDDESRAFDRSWKEKGEATGSEEKPASDLVKSVDSLLAEVTHHTAAAAEKTTSFVADKPVVIHSTGAALAEKTTSLAEEKVTSLDSDKLLVPHSSGDSPAEKTTSLVAEKAPSLDYDKSVATHSTGDTLAQKTTSLVAEKAPSLDYDKPVVTHSTGDALAQKTTSLVAEKAPSLGAAKPVVTVCFSETTPVDGLVISGTVIKMELEDDAEKMLPTSVPETLIDSLPEKIESILAPLLTENGKASLSVVESVSKENGSKVLPSLGVSPAQTSNDARSVKDSETPEYSESQPLVAPPPRVVEKTSWFGCCGILDVITGSRR